LRISSLWIDLVTPEDLSREKNLCISQGLGYTAAGFIHFTSCAHVCWNTISKSCIGELRLFGQLGTASHHLFHLFAWFSSSHTGIIMIPKAYVPGCLLSKCLHM